MKIQLSDHFTYKKLLRFTFPAIIMLVFTSIYGVVDGFFVSNFVGKTHFDKGSLIKTCVNGSSELTSNISMSVVNMLYKASF